MTFVDLLEKAQVADFETAVHYAGYGRFQILLLGICGLIYATCAISTTTLSFVLPSAECDFHLTSMDKGKLSAMPLIGMIFGCGIWGYVADSRGRKPALIIALLVDFVAAFASSFARDFKLFLACRFFNGFGIIGATSIIFPYLGEFYSIKLRDSVLGRLEIFWNVGVIALPGVAWAILGHPTAVYFSSWRVFVLVCGIPSLLSVIFLFLLPETPKYLMSHGRFGKAKAVFQRMFVCNTRNHAKEYPVVILEGETENNNNSLTIQEHSQVCSHQLRDRLEKAAALIKKLFGQPYLKYMAITAFADFGLMASYYTLMMWFPEIFERFNQFAKSHPNQHASVCVVSESISDSEMLKNSTTCDNSINTRVFIDTFIIGLSCIPTSVSLSFFMRKLGKKFVLICGLVLSGFCTMALNWVASSTQTLILSCIFEALTSILEAVLFCVVVDLFPTNLRAIALSITATSGRLGAIFGNVLFGMLIDINCVIPIHVFGSLLILSGILCIAVPHSDEYIVLHE